MGEISVKTGNNARNGGKNSLNRLIRCVCGKKIGPDPRNFNQRVSLGRNDLLIRTFPNTHIKGIMMKKLILSGIILGLLSNAALANNYTAEDMMSNAWILVLQSKGKSTTEAIDISSNLVDIASGKATRAAMRGQECSTSSQKIANDMKANAYNLGASVADVQALVKYTSEYAEEVCHAHKDSH
ncbi:hypothetical protein [Klebsiella quasipneumoniae]|uniref:hypothetical protein n=1 Tax=Klebsiella quasipneumoniae TaxID=1463165 RepID=UPI003FA5CF76